MATKKSSTSPPKQTTLTLEPFTITVTFKRVKNLNLRIAPPKDPSQAPTISLSAPYGTSMAVVRAFVKDKLPWLKAKCEAMQKRPPADVRNTFLALERHYLWGERCRLQIVECDGNPTVTHTTTRKAGQDGHMLILHTPANPLTAPRQLLEGQFDAWYVQELTRKARPYIAHWEAELDVKMKNLRIRRMTSRWGSCTTTTGNIRLNTRLVHKPEACLDYVVLHELAHLIEANHGPRFKAILHTHMPDWKKREDLTHHFPTANPDEALEL